MACQKDCPINCVKCDRNNGNCSVCEGGKYLADCSQSCSASCNTTDGKLLCAIEDGACLNGCVSLNIYGAHCEKICSNNCKYNVCSWLTGDCGKGCQNSHWGKQCEHVCNANCISINGATTCNETNGQCLAGCIDGYHSGQCEKSCSINCLNISCDTRGKCIYGCSGDFVDDLCLQVKYISAENGNGDAATVGGSVGGALALTIIAIVAAIVLFIRRRKSEDNTEGNHENNTVVYSNMENRQQNCDTVTSTAERLSTAYEIIARGDDSAEYSALSFHTNQTAAFLDIGSRPSEQVDTEKIQTIYEKPILKKEMREYAALEYDTSQTSDEYLPGHKDKKQNQSLSSGKEMERNHSRDNKTKTGACSSDQRARGVREDDRTDYIHTSLAGISRAKKYP